MRLLQVLRLNVLFFHFGIAEGGISLPNRCSGGLALMGRSEFLLLEDVLKLLEIAAAGSQSEWARIKGENRPVLNYALRGRRKLQPSQSFGVPTLSQSVSILRFFFRVTLGRADIVNHTQFVHEPRKLPVILSPEEVARFLDAAPGLKYKAALSVAYGAGLRVSEVVALKVGHARTCWNQRRCRRSATAHRRALEYGVSFAGRANGPHDYSRALLWRLSWRISPGCHRLVCGFSWQCT
jgi:integrase